MSQPSPMTPADLANTIAAAREEAYSVARQEAVVKLYERGFNAWPQGLAYSVVNVAGIRAAERYLALWQALTSLTDWRVDKAIEHLSDLRQVAVEAGLSDDKVALVDRYTGWFINAQEKRQALAQAAEDNG